MTRKAEFSFSVIIILALAIISIVSCESTFDSKIGSTNEVKFALDKGKEPDSADVDFFPPEVFED